MDGGRGQPIPSFLPQIAAITLRTVHAIKNSASQGLEEIAIYLTANI